MAKSLLQRCTKCAGELSFMSDAAIDSEVACGNGHRHRIAKCPVGPCPAKRLAIAVGSKKGKRVDHAGACEAQLWVVSRNPTVLERV